MLTFCQNILKTPFLKKNTIHAALCTPTSFSFHLFLPQWGSQCLHKYIVLSKLWKVSSNKIIRGSDFLLYSGTFKDPGILTAGQWYTGAVITFQIKYLLVLSPRLISDWCAFLIGAVPMSVCVSPRCPPACVPRFPPALCDCSAAKELAPTDGSCLSSWGGNSVSPKKHQLSLYVPNTLVCSHVHWTILLSHYFCCMCMS